MTARWLLPSFALVGIVVAGGGRAAAQAPGGSVRANRPARAPEARSYRLRADALGQAFNPTGVLSVQGDMRPTDWVRAEALIWGGTGELGDEADVLVGRVTLRDPGHRADLHLGRMVVGAGAMRPVHFDGAHGIVRAPWHMKVETYGGVSVAPRFEERDYDWLVGGRIGQSLPGVGTVGVAYLQRRVGGRLDDHEVGGDLSFTLFEQVTVSGRAAWDLQNPGFSEALANLSYRPSDGWRFEVYGSHRSASRILPATSLFSVLGDVAADQGGARVRWRAAPRLDVVVDGGARSFSDSVGERGRLRVVLRLDDFGDSSIAGQVERAGGPADVAYSGARLIYRQRFARVFLFATELELVRPDESDVPVTVAQLDGRLAPSPTRGEWWPWGLVSLEVQPTEQWIVAAAVEASATSSYEQAVDGLLRVTWLWGAP